MSLKLKIPASSVRAAITSNSYNATDNTIEVVFATEFEVQRRTWDGTKFIEILECSTSSVRLDRLNSGANLVDSHSTYSVQTILGVVVRAWVENNQCKAIIRLSKREDAKGVVGDIIDGIITNISVGYSIFGATQIDNDDEIIRVRITDWEPFELTVLSVPADYTAGVRSQDKSNFFELSINKRSNMTPEEIAAAAAAEAERTRAATPPVPATPVLPTPAAPDNSAIIAQERTRVMQITQNVRVAQIDDETFLDGLITRGLTVESANTEIFARLQGAQTAIRGQSAGQVRITADEADKYRVAMQNALMHRANPSVPLNEGSDFRGMTLMDMARDSAERAGIKTRGMSRRELAATALNATRSAGMHSTSDFPLILGNTVNRVLRDEYAVQLPTFNEWASRGVAKDFRTMTKVGLGEVGDFKEVKEGAEYEYTTLGEGGESYKVVKYGQIIAITWETLINDDMDAFSRIPRKIVAAATRKQSDIVYAILTGSHKMSDGKQLFHADHGNLLDGSAISIDSIGKMRLAMREQKGLGGKEYLNLTPKFLITGSANEQAALQYTSTNFAANTPGGINVWSGLVKPIIEARIPGNAWYFAASPSAIDTIEYSFLEGEQELFTEQRQGFEVDGLEIKARMVFGAKAIDWRGLSKNSGI
jgi:hypothetical protein